MKLSHKVDKFLGSSGHRRAILLSFDMSICLLINVFYYIAAANADNSMPVDHMGFFCVHVLLQLALIMIVRMALGAYQNVWRYPDTRAYLCLVTADTVANLCTLVFLRIANEYIYGIYRGIWQAVSTGAMIALLTLVSRFSYAMIYRLAARHKENMPKVPVAVAGAGRLGTYLVDDLINNPKSTREPIFFVDTDRSKIGQMVSHLKVYSEEAGDELIKKLGIREVLIAIAGIDGDDMAKLFTHYRNLGCKVRIYESLVDETNTQKGVLREFSINDLLQRNTREVGTKTIQDFYAGKTVLVTGGGGSIGSELCRQIVRCNPRKLIIFDAYENNAYDIQQELLRSYGSNLDLAVEIGTVRDPERLDQLFDTYRPDVVFHAAAHKHVPLMEHCGADAVSNNCLGTYNTANAAEKYGVSKFILISSDKAVNPTNIMGATKRVCEMIIQSRTDSKTCFSAVRFGNVLGSNGSVIPLFKKQIASGGPVTITDKRIIRYFMTIPEASQLVLHAGAMANRGELFVLDMGKPVKIYDLAVNMILLSGLTPGQDIEIQEVGLRPGEKLYEELLMKPDQLDKTANDLIFIERNPPMSRAEVEYKLRVLRDAIAVRGDMRSALSSVVPTFYTPEQVNRDAENCAEIKSANDTTPVC